MGEKEIGLASEYQISNTSEGREDNILIDVNLQAIEPVSV